MLNIILNNNLEKPLYKQIMIEIKESIISRERKEVCIMYDRSKLDDTLLNDLKIKSENPSIKNDEYLKALFSTSISDIFEEHICCAECNKQ